MRHTGTVGRGYWGSGGALPTAYRSVTGSCSWARGMNRGERAGTRVDRWQHPLLHSWHDLVAKWGRRRGGLVTPGWGRRRWRRAAWLALPAWETGVTAGQAFYTIVLASGSTVPATVPLQALVCTGSRVWGEARNGVRPTCTVSGPQDGYLPARPTTLPACHDTQRARYGRPRATAQQQPVGRCAPATPALPPRGRRRQAAPSP